MHGVLSPPLVGRFSSLVSLDLGKGTNMESWVDRGRIPKIWEEKGEGLSLKVERKQKAGRKAKLI